MNLICMQHSSIKHASAAITTVNPCDTGLSYPESTDPESADFSCLAHYPNSKFPGVLLQCEVTEAGSVVCSITDLIQFPAALSAQP